MKYFLIALFICCATITYSDTLAVGPGQQYETIQSAINAADDGDFITVYPLSFGEAYSAINFLSKDLYISGIANPKINGENSPIVVNMNYADYANFIGFIVTGSATSIGINCTNASIQEVFDNTVENVEKGIYISDCPYITVQNNQLRENVSGCFISNENPESDIVHLNSNKIYDNNIGVYIDEIHSVTLLLNSIYHNDTGISMSNNPLIHTYISNSTISGNANGIIFGTYSQGEIYNSIIWQNDATFTNTPASLNITYSCIEENYAGTGNINTNPKFCMEGYYAYHLLEGSPCIDTGDPEETDPDGTFCDMGCYPSTTDIKSLKGNHWNWVSFPRLEREGNDPVIAYQLLEDMIPFPDEMTLMFGDETVLTYEYSNWSNVEYEITSDIGYKLNPQEEGAYILPEPGSRLSAGYTKTVSPNQENWIGYWLPYTQSYEYALGDQLDHIEAIYAENWYLFKRNGRWYGMSTGTIEEQPGTFEYGKGYMLIVSEQFNLHWIHFGVSPTYEKSEIEFFSYEDKPNYEAIEIDSIENGENVLEVGVFQDDVCVGASKVENFPVHLMAYTDAMSRGDDLTFELNTGRGTTEKYKTVLKYDFKSGKYISTTLRPLSSRFSLIKLTRSDENTNNEPSPFNLNNYPNPFNPTTTISFMQPKKSEINLTIYNLKGQMVKNLIRGETPEGLQKVIWDGNDENSNPVSSGIYLYHLKTEDKVISKKMILMK
ncbi:MAG: NosD domain-containing protein [Candidatus Cloacimonadota bacterium]|nr:NosD domain-containing protein [Candidatus Cloacimonadota bacterium]